MRKLGRIASALALIWASLLAGACEVETPDPAGDLATLLILDQLGRNPSKFGFSRDGNLASMADTNQGGNSGNGFVCDTGGEANNCIVPSFGISLVGNNGELIGDAEVTVQFNGKSSTLTPASVSNPVYVCDECPALAQGDYITDFVGQEVTLSIRHPGRGIDATGKATITRQFDSISLNGSTIFPDSISASLYRHGSDEISWEAPAANIPPKLTVQLRDGSIFDEDANTVDLIISSDGGDGSHTIQKDLSGLDTTAFGHFGYAVGLSPFSWEGTQPQEFQAYDDSEDIQRSASDTLLLKSVCNVDDEPSYSCENPDSYVSTDLIVN